MADAMTKFVDRWTSDEYMAAMSFTCQVARTKHLALNSLVHLPERSRFHLDHVKMPLPCPDVS